MGSEFENAVFNFFHIAIQHEKKWIKLLSEGLLLMVPLKNVISQYSALNKNICTYDEKTVEMAQANALYLIEEEFTALRATLKDIDNLTNNLSEKMEIIEKLGRNHDLRLSPSRGKHFPSFVELLRYAEDITRHYKMEIANIEIALNDIDYMDPTSIDSASKVWKFSISTPVSIKEILACCAIGLA